MNTRATDHHREPAVLSDATFAIPEDDGDPVRRHLGKTLPNPTIELGLNGDVVEFRHHVVEDRPDTPEHPRQPVPLTAGGVSPVGVPLQHHSTVTGTLGFMGSELDTRAGRHVVHQPHAHLVFVTKYRRPVFTATHLARLEDIFRQVCADFECDLVRFNGETSHVHLLVTFPPKVALSHLVKSLKGVSSRSLRRDFPDLEHHYRRTKRLWSGSYFAHPDPCFDATSKTRTAPPNRCSPSH